MSAQAITRAPRPASFNRPTPPSRTAWPPIARSLSYSVKPRSLPPSPAVPGALTAGAALATGRSIAAEQQRDGAIGWPDGHVDAWNHVECAMALGACGLRDAARRAYDWLRVNPRDDGSWPRQTDHGAVTDAAAESNHAAYPAVGVWHEFLRTEDREFAERMWPVVHAGIEFALGLQLPRGEVADRK